MVNENKSDCPSRIDVVLILWGKSYWDTFITSSLKSRLLPKGLVELLRHFKVVYHIYSTKADIDKYQGHESIAKFSKLGFVLKFHSIDHFFSENKYALFSKIQSQAITEAKNYNSGLIFDFPDHFYLQSFFSNISMAIRRGKRLIMVPGVRLALEVFNESLDAEISKTGCVEIPNNRLLKLAQHALHANLSLPTFSDSRSVPHWQSSFLWRVDELDFFQTAFHYHPFYIWPEKEIKLVCQTIDQSEFLFASCPDKSKHYLDVSSKSAYFELSREMIDAGQKLEKRSFIKIVYWMHSHVHPEQFKYIKKKKFYGNSKPDYFSWINLRIFFFSRSLIYFHLLPKIIKKICYWKHHQERVQKKISLLKFIKKIRILNYFEMLLNNQYYYFDIVEIIDFFKRNEKKISKEVARRVLAQKLLQSPSKKQSFVVKKISESFWGEDLYGQFVHEVAKSGNEEVLNLIFTDHSIDKLSPKRLGAFIKELALQKKETLLGEALKKDELIKKLPKSSLRKTLKLLKQNNSTALFEQLVRSCRL